MFSDLYLKIYVVQKDLILKIFQLFFGVRSVSWFYYDNEYLYC